MHKLTTHNCTIFPKHRSLQKIFLDRNSHFSCRYFQPRIYACFCKYFVSKTFYNIIFNNDTLYANIRHIPTFLMLYFSACKICTPYLDVTFFYLQSVAVINTADKDPFLWVFVVNCFKECNIGIIFATRKTIRLSVSIF